jgi:hypothetical protein
MMVLNNKLLDMKYIFNLTYPVGTYYFTSDINFNPNTSFAGTWVLDQDGTVLVSHSNTSGSTFNANIGTIVGEEKHKLTIAELAGHDHYRGQYTDNPNNGGFFYVYVNGNNAYGETRTDKTGGDQPHNNVQPSKIGNRWHRTA